MIAAVVTLLAGAAGATPANAAVVPCAPTALIDAIDAANAAADPDVLELASGCTYVIQARAVDAAGNASTVRSVTVTIASH